MTRKKWLLLSFALFVIGGAALTAGVWLCLESAVRHRAVAAPREAFKKADRFEILFVESGNVDAGDETFSISPFRESYRVIDHVDLSDRKSEEFRQLISEHFLTKEFSAMCHDPHHAIRAFRGSRPVFEATLCLECINLEFAAFRLFPVEVTILEREQAGTELPALEKFLEELRKRS